MINGIVFFAAALAVAFTACWFWSPRLRAWIERPKYRFQEDLRSYDRRQKIGNQPIDRDRS